MPYPAALLRNERTGVCAILVLGIRNLRHIVELEKVNIVCFHHPETVLDIGKHTAARSCCALCGNDDIVTDAAQRKADLLLTVGIRRGGIKNLMPRS